MQKWVFILLILLALSLPGVSIGLAESGGGFTLSWFTLDGGGVTAGGGAYTLSGTLGQPDAGTMEGGEFTLAGGYWSGATGSFPQTIYLPVIRKP